MRFLSLSYYLDSFGDRVRPHVEAVRIDQLPTPSWLHAALSQPGHMCGRSCAIPSYNVPIKRCTTAAMAPLQSVRPDRFTRNDELIQNGPVFSLVVMTSSVYKRAVLLDWNENLDHHSHHHPTTFQPFKQSSTLYYISKQNILS